MKQPHESKKSVIYYHKPPTVFMKPAHKLIMCRLIPILTASPLHADWSEVFSDPGTSDWESKWFLDGNSSEITNTPEGMVFKTGPLEGGDASHGVLWTRESFEGDIRIEYDFTRLDSNMDHPAVCLLYVHATGIGKAPFSEDIRAWAGARHVPAMSHYFKHMKLYHVSYAVTGGRDNRYIRARQYPMVKEFGDTILEPGYDNVDLFKPGETWHIVFEKIGQNMSFSASKGEESHTWTWDLSSRSENLDHGRVGLRQMRWRESRFANFKIFTREAGN